MDEQQVGVPVQIHLETTTNQEGETTDYQLDVTGQLVEMGTSLYLRYMEEDPESGDHIPVTMKLNQNGDVQLTRSGENRLRLHFSAGKRIEARYKTPYGVLPIETVTPRLDVSIYDRPLRGDLVIDYYLYAGEQLLGDYKIRLQFTA